MSVSDYAPLYQQAGEQYGVDPKLLMAQAQVESGGNPKAYNDDTDASGIAQIIPATAKSLGVSDPSDPKQAIPAQAKLMAENIKRYGNISDAVSAYHGGTDHSNWGPKTAAYKAKVLQNYQGTQMASNQSQEVDPIEAALNARAAEKNLPGTSAVTSADDSDPIEQALTKRSKEAPDPPKKQPVTVPEDLAETAISAPIKAVGALTQIPAMIGNAVANSGGYTYGKLAGATPEQQEKLNNLNPFFTGSTSADALTQAGNAIVNNDPGPANPLTGSVLHDPETRIGRYENALIQGAVGGPATGLKLLPSLAGAVGAQTGAEVAPGNPLAPLVGGLAAGAAVPAAAAVRFRSTPEEMASNALQNSADQKNTNSLQPANINSTEIVPGSKPTLAQITDDPNIALLERQLQSKNPAAFKALEDTNEAARKDHFEQASGTPQDIEALKDQREQTTTPLYEVARKQPLNTTAISPILSKIDAAIEEVGDGSDAGKTLASIKAKIEGALPTTDATGKSKNPTQSPLIQIYREERDNLQKPATAQGAYAGTVKSVIQPIIGQLGDAIESQSPEFAKAQQTYRDISPQIESAQWMQGLKLTDATGRFTLAKVNNALQNAQRMRSSNGLNAAKSLTPNQMTTLTNVRDDLLRRENVARASMPRGSNTAQNLLNAADAGSFAGRANKLVGGNLPELAGSAVGSGIGSLVGAPGLGAFSGDLAARALKGMSGRRTEAATNALQDFVLSPENYKNYLINAHKNNYLERLPGSFLKNP